MVASSYRGARRRLRVIRASIHLCHAYQGERTASWVVIAVATCAASRYRTLRRDVVPDALGVAETVAIRTHGRNGSQIRSTSPFDIPLRSASATTVSEALTTSDAERCLSFAMPTAAAGPRASANAARSATRK